MSYHLPGPQLPHVDTKGVGAIHDASICRASCVDQVSFTGDVLTGDAHRGPSREGSSQQTHFIGEEREDKSLGQVTHPLTKLGDKDHVPHQGLLAPSSELSPFFQPSPRHQNACQYSLP